MLTAAMLDFVVSINQASSIDFLTGLVHRRYHRSTGDAALAVKSEKGEVEIFTELSPWFVIHALVADAAKEPKATERSHQV